MKITGVITQGAKDFGSVQFVSAFKVAHSQDGRSWTIVQDPKTRTDQVWGGWLGEEVQVQGAGQGCDVMLCVCRSSRETATTTSTKRTSLSRRSSPATSACCPGSGTSESHCGWSCWAAANSSAPPSPSLSPSLPSSLSTSLVLTQDCTASLSAAGGSKQQRMPDNTATHWTDQGLHSDPVPAIPPRPPCW